jgi:hypothetical protein
MRVESGRAWQFFDNPDPVAVRIKAIKESNSAAIHDRHHFNTVLDQSGMRVFNIERFEII